MERAEGLECRFQESGDSSFGEVVRGVAILLAARPDIGVTDPSLESEGLEHRLLGLRLRLPGLEPFLVVSAYLQVGAGLGRTNRAILATVARWQDEAKLPILVGGDFNLKPALVLGTDFPSRSGTQVLAPRDSTYRTSTARATIDYFIVSSCLSNKLQGCHVVGGFPLKPHLPVRVGLKLGQLEWVPVLDRPSKLPTDAPIGPRREPLDWTELGDRVEQAH